MTKISKSTASQFVDAHPYTVSASDYATPSPLEKAASVLNKGSSKVLTEGLKDKATASMRPLKKVRFDPNVKVIPIPKRTPSPRFEPHLSSPMFLTAGDVQAARLRAFGSGMQVRDVRKNAIIKDGLSYLLASAAVAGSGGIAALTQPLIRAALNMVQQSIGHFRDGSGNVFARLGRALGGGLGSLANDVSAVFRSLNNCVQAPGKYMKRHLLDGTQAPKTWGHMGALVGGLVGGLMGGPVMAGVGFLAGRYAGQALGRLLSYASGNSGLTLGESARQALFAGFAGLTASEVDKKITEIDEKKATVVEALCALKPGEKLSDPKLEQDRQRLLQLADALENNYDMLVPLEDYAAQPITDKDRTVRKGIVNSLTVQEYCDALRMDMMTQEEQQAAEMARLKAAGIDVDMSVSSDEKKVDQENKTAA